MDKRPSPSPSATPLPKGEARHKRGFSACLSRRKRGICLLTVLLLLLPTLARAAPLYGTLHIPAADIEVRLYRSDTQAVADAKNSAAMFKRDGSWIIADHNNQEFNTLPDVGVYDMAWIDKEDGETVLLVCCNKFPGKNTGHEITDLDGRNVMGDHDYLMYTCRKGKGWRNVVVTQWVEVDIEDGS